MKIMKLRVKQDVSSRVNLKTNSTLIAAGAVIFTGLIIFAFTFGINFFGLQHSGKAEPAMSSRYPFDLSDEVLTRVNFTVLAPQINSVFEEVRPFITANGNELFFCRRNHPDNISKQKDKQDIWVTTLGDNGQWSNAVNLGLTINTRDADAICSISPDGSEIVFINENIDPDKPIGKSKRLRNGWTIPEMMEVENFYNRNDYIDFYYSFEANVLLMAVEREDSNGDQDLYVSFPIEKNKWSEPLNLGAVVNSLQSDFAPFLSRDGKTLFFSSYGHSGFGGCDIFQTTRLDDSWKNWTKPKNLGEGINSAREESYFSISGDYKYIFFESYLADGMRDIFRADLPMNFKPEAMKDSPTVVSSK